MPTKKRQGGRPPIGDEAMVRSTIFLLPQHLAAAETAMPGNLSGGIRKLLDEAIAAARRR